MGLIVQKSKVLRKDTGYTQTRYLSQQYLCILGLGTLQSRHIRDQRIGVLLTHRKYHRPEQARAYIIYCPEISMTKTETVAEATGLELAISTIRSSLPERLLKYASNS